MKYFLKKPDGSTLDAKSDKLPVVCAMAAVMSKGKSDPVLVLTATDVAAGFAPVQSQEVTAALSLGVSGGTISKAVMKRYIEQLQKAA